MVEINSSNIVLDRFMNYVKNRIEELAITRNELLKNIEQVSRLLKYKDDINISDLLTIKEYLLQLKPSLLDDYNIIEFFSDQDNSNLPQVGEAFNNISDFFKSLKNINISELQIRIKSIESIINDCEAFISGKSYNAITVITLLDNSDFSIEEQNIVLESIAESISPSIIEENKDKSEVLDTNSKYEKALKTAKRKLCDNFDYYMNITSQELSIASMRVNDIKESYGMSNTVYPVLIYKIKNLIGELSEVLKNNLPSKDELYRELIDTLYYIDSFKLTESPELVERDTKVFFLLDEEGNPLFPLYVYNQDQKDKITDLVDKLINIPGEIPNGRLVQDAWLEDNKIKAYTKNFGDMYCSYLKMPEGKILIVYFDLKADVYRNTKAVIRKNMERITEIINLIRSNDVEFYAKQKYFLDNLSTSLNSKKGGGRI